MEIGMEIGSIYEIDPELLRRSQKTEEAFRDFGLREAEKYGKKYVRYTASGREAIALALKSIEANKRDVAKRCLLPAYMCDTVFFPFERAGWEMAFYPIDRRMRADAAELERLVEEFAPGLIFIHPYYGVDTWKDMRPLLRGWRARGICIMEDVTQSYYLEGAGAEADYCVGSLRKWYAVPDGGFAASDEPFADLGRAVERDAAAGALAQEARPVLNGLFVGTRQALMSEKWRYLHGEGDPQEKQALKDHYLKKNREMEAWLDGYAGISPLSNVSAHLLSLADEAACRKRRQENWDYLHERLAHCKKAGQVAPVFGGEYEGVSLRGAAALYYPVYARNRDELQRYLAANGVYAPTLWPVGKENAAWLSAEERYIYGHILALPIDQRYGIEEMRRVAELLEQYGEATAMGGGCGMEATEGRHDREGQTVGIRVDANEEIATGHVMRCITIAKHLAASACRVVFYTADEYAGEMLAEAGMAHVCLHTRWDRPEEELPFLRRELQKAGCGKLLVDSYRVTGAYFDGLRDLCKLIYIDDCFAEIYPADMVINYNAYHTRFPYKEAYAGKAKLLLGTAYVPLREEFGGRGESPGERAGLQADAEQASGRGEAKNDTSVTKKHVLLSSGGGDLCGALAGILEMAVQDGAFEDVIFHVVVGGFHRNAAELEELAAGHPNIRLHCRVEHMARLMEGCMAAVSAAGTMLFELSAMQIPTVFFVSADNQQYDSEFFAREERMLFAGDIRREREACLGRIGSQLKRLLEDEEMQRRMKEKLHDVTDGQGARRIAAEIVEL